MKRRKQKEENASDRCCSFLFLSFWFLLLVFTSEAAQEKTPSTALRPVSTMFPDVIVWTDTCNVYVVRDGERALLIDLGDGTVLDHLGEIGVKQVDWVLFTHHHREQCQGASKLKGAQVGAPAAERDLFENPSKYRKMNVRLNDAFTIHGTSYVRPPIRPIPVDR